MHEHDALAVTSVRLEFTIPCLLRKSMSKVELLEQSYVGVRRGDDLLQRNSSTTALIPQLYKTKNQNSMLVRLFPRRVPRHQIATRFPHKR
jgi:hypothetical protein